MFRAVFFWTGSSTLPRLHQNIIQASGDYTPEACFVIAPPYFRSLRDRRSAYGNPAGQSIIPPGYCEEAVRPGRSNPEADSIVIPASARESSVSTITLLCRLRLLMQTNPFNCPVMQTVVFTLIPWILDQVEDDTVPIVIARRPSGQAEAI